MIDSIFYSQTEDVLDDVEIMSSISRESDERLGKFELKKKKDCFTGYLQKKPYYFAKNVLSMHQSLLVTKYILHIIP